MMNKNVVTTILSNKVVMYMITRYATYGLAFLISMYIATKMGPRYYGLWGYLLLFFSYFNLINWGIPQSVMVLMIQHKESKKISENYEKTGLWLVGMISLVGVFVIVYYCFGGFVIIHNNNVGLLLVAICLCGMINYFLLFYGKIYRVKNRLLEVSLQQSSVVAMMLLSLFFFRNEALLYGLVGSYVIAHISSLLLYLFNGGANFSGTFSLSLAKEIFRKGLYLFIFNSGFYFIIVSTQSIISGSYSMEEFGYFTFAYMLGKAVFQFLDAFASLITVKLIDRYRAGDKKEVLSTIRYVRDNYVVLFFGVMFLAMIVFPIFISLIPKYENTIQAVNFVSLTLLLYTNSFGYATYLQAQNKEKILAMVAVLSLIVNLALGFFLADIIHIGYEYVISCTMVAYLVYAWMSVYYGRVQLGLSLNVLEVVNDMFPIRLLIPFLFSFIITIFELYSLMFLSFISFVIFNSESIKSIYLTCRKLLSNPDIINI